MSNDIINKEFREFGERMNIILICSILNILLPWFVIPGLIVFIYSILVLGNAKRINEQLNDANLQKFRSLYIASVTIPIFTVIAVAIAAIPYIVGLVGYFIGVDPATIDEAWIISILPEIVVLIAPLLIIGLIGIIIIFLASIIQMKAWDGLNLFFRQNSGLFPDHIANDAIEGSKCLKTASLCYILFFLIITIPIGLIYRILGYMKLSRLKNLGISSSKPSAQPQASPAPKDDSRFCSECGSAVKKSESFCNSCGAKL